MQAIDNNIIKKEIEKLQSEHIDEKQNTQKVVEIFTRCNPNLIEKTNYLEILVNYTQNQQLNSRKFTSKTTNAYYNIINIIKTILTSFNQENKFKSFDFLLNENKNMSYVKRLTLKTNKEQKMRRHF
jgi:hypothetical protein